MSTIATPGRTCWYRSPKLEHEGITGLVHWETLNKTKIEGVTSAVQEAQHFLEDFYLVHVSPLSLRKASLAGLSSSAPDPCDALLPTADNRGTDK